MNGFKYGLLGAGLVMALGARAGLDGALAKDPGTASMIFGMQISESLGNVPLQLQDGNGAHRISDVTTGDCATTFSGGGQAWSIDWRTDNNFQRGNTNLLLAVSDRGPIGVSAAGLSDSDATHKAAFDKAQKAMEHLWGNCS